MRISDDILAKRITAFYVAATNGASAEVCDTAWRRVMAVCDTCCDRAKVLFTVARAAIEAHDSTCRCGLGSNLTELHLVGLNPDGTVAHGPDDAPPAVLAAARFVVASVNDDEDTAGAVYHSIPRTDVQALQFLESLVRAFSAGTVPRILPTGQALPGAHP